MTKTTEGQRRQLVLCLLKEHTILLDYMEHEAHLMNDEDLEAILALQVDKVLSIKRLELIQNMLESGTISKVYI